MSLDLIALMKMGSTEMLVVEVIEVEGAICEQAFGCSGGGL